MPLHTWWTFFVAAFFISGTPGPNMLHMLSTGMRHGLRNTFYTMAGCGLAVFSITLLSALGMGTLLAASPRVFGVLRILGAAYLVYLGARIAFQPTSAPLDSEITADIPASATPRQHFKSGLVVGLSNPKLLLFATAFFPQFIDSTAPELPQICILLTTFCIIDFSWYVAYATGGSRLARLLRREKMRKAMNRCVGTLFAGFGVLLLKFRPN